MLNIRKSTKADMPALMEVFAEARGTIAMLGINQWQDGYPNETVIMEDVEQNRSFSVEKEGEVVGTFALMYHGEPTYDVIHSGNWLSGEDGAYLAIHRVAVAVKSRGTGISSAIIEFAATEALNAHKKSLRIDTHEGNVVMRRMLEKNGFSYCGIIYLENGDPRVAYERML